VQVFRSFTELVILGFGWFMTGTAVGLMGASVELSVVDFLIVAVVSVADVVVVVVIVVVVVSVVVVMGLLIENVSSVGKTIGKDSFLGFSAVVVVVVLSVVVVVVDVVVLVVVVVVVDVVVVGSGASPSL